ncbi:MAG: hypothetical protein KIS66_11505 [Fimbriimonadaceae bacterium]|nr:hypothetical protein [Fimbriimonadaceae bacterium]
MNKGRTRAALWVGGLAILAVGVWVAWPSARCPVSMPAAYTYLGYTPPPTTLAFAEMAQRDPADAGGAANWLFEGTGSAEVAAQRLAAYLSAQGTWRPIRSRPNAMHVLRSSDGSCLIAVFPKRDDRGAPSAEAHRVRVNGYWRGPNVLERALAGLPPPLLRSLSGR